MAAVSKAWDSQQDAEVAATILELFHMLPAQAVKFLETSQVPFYMAIWPTSIVFNAVAV